MMYYVPAFIFLFCGLFGYLCGYLVEHYRENEVSTPEQAIHLVLFTCSLLLAVVFTIAGTEKLRYSPIKTSAPPQVDTIRTIKTGCEPDTLYIYTFDKEVTK